MDEFFWEIMAYQGKRFMMFLGKVLVEAGVIASILTAIAVCLYLFLTAIE